STAQKYDVSGNLVQVTDATNGAANRDFVNDESGKVLQKTQGASVQRFMIADGKVMANLGDGTTPPDFSLSYAKVDSVGTPNNTPDSYTVMPGDTLQSIAQTEWGDSSLWYLVADANGLQGNMQLRAGQHLVMPARI